MEEKIKKQRKILIIPLLGTVIVMWMTIINNYVNLRKTNKNALITLLKTLALHVLACIPVLVVLGVWAVFFLVCRVNIFGQFVPLVTIVVFYISGYLMVEIEKQVYQKTQIEDNQEDI